MITYPWDLNEFVRHHGFLEQSLLQTGQVISVARVNVLDDRRGVDPHRPVALKPPHLDLHRGLGGFLGMELLGLELELVRRIAVLVAQIVTCLKMVKIIK